MCGMVIFKNNFSAAETSLPLYLCSLGLSWEYCVGITTDGAASMTGKHFGVVKRILERNHYFLHREALAAKNTVPLLDEALTNVIKVVNHIKVQKVAVVFHICVKTWALSTCRCCITQKSAGCRGAMCCHAFMNLKQKSPYSSQRLTQNCLTTKCGSQELHILLIFLSTSTH